MTDVLSVSAIVISLISLAFILRAVDAMSLRMEWYNKLNWHDLERMSHYDMVFKFWRDWYRWYPKQKVKR